MAEYFGQDVHDYIDKFISSSSQEEKNALFEYGIRPAFETLIHNIIFVYKFQNVDDVGTMKSECLTHLYEMIPKFDPTRGTKAFSYFNVVAKNWFINRSKDAKRREKNESDLPAGLDYERFRNTQTTSTKHFEDDVVEKEFWMSFYAEMTRWMEDPDCKIRDQERAVLDKIIFLFKSSDSISIHSPKAVHIYLKELTNLSSKQISSSLKRLREMYDEWKRRHIDDPEA